MENSARTGISTLQAAQAIAKTIACKRTSTFSTQTKLNLKKSQILV